MQSSASARTNTRIDSFDAVVRSSSTPHMVCGPRYWESATMAPTEGTGGGPARRELARGCRREEEEWMAVVLVVTGEKR